MTDENGHYLDYEGQARRFLDQAFEELEQDDLRQASEKGWGAAAQIVKAAAEERGLDHTRHHLLHVVVGRLSAESSDGQLIPQFGTANLLHTNFYEGGFSKENIRDSLSQVSQFIEKVEGLLNGRNGASSSN